MRLFAGYVLGVICSLGFEWYVKTTFPSLELVDMSMLSGYKERDLASFAETVGRPVVVPCQATYEKKASAWCALFNPEGVTDNYDPLTGQTRMFKGEYVKILTEKDLGDW
jgi:hypothetical protein